MNLKQSVKFSVLILLVSAGVFVFSLGSRWEAKAALNLNGRILLQVQDKGQAWYVNPLNSKRYYLGRPDDAFGVMRFFGLGVSNSDLNIFLQKAPSRLAGRILLKVQDKGQAYYVDPIELKLYYLGRPSDAFNVMRTRGLGITNRDLATIAIAVIENTISTPPTNPVVSTEKIGQFTFKYKNANYELIQELSPTLYDTYKNSPKVYTYIVGQEPASIQEEFYGLFLKTKNNDNSITELITKLREIALRNNWNDDELVEFVVAFVQYIPYDESKVSTISSLNTNPYFPYETLYLNKGVCSDKTFLGVALLRKLGYGAAILDFPDRNHSALGVECPIEYSINNSGYCYGETTNYFPLGVIPQIIDNGQAQSATEFTSLFNSESLGKMEIYQATNAKVYQGMSALKARVEALKLMKADLATRQVEINDLNSKLLSKEAEITTLRNQMTVLLSNGQRAEYNALIPTFNNLVNNYNEDLLVYQARVDEYNAKISEYNSLSKAFYQQ